MKLHRLHNLFAFIKSYYLFIFVISVTLLFFSCATNEKEISSEFQPLPLDVKTPQEILQLYIDMDPIQAITITERFEKEQLIAEEEKISFTKKSHKEAEKDLAELITKKEYKEAWLLSKNILVAGGTVTVEQQDTILTELIVEYLEQENYPAVAQYMKKFDTIFSQGIEESAHYEKLLEISETIAQHYATEDDPAGIEDLLQSTFIIEINNGIGISEDGSGPDIQGSLGSAFFISKDGYALTNEHVITTEVDPSYEGISDMSARLPVDDFRARPAKVIGYDNVLDLALIKVPYTPSYVYPISDIEVTVGEDVKAIGSPLGLSNSVTSGIVSGKDRRILNVGGVLQIDAPVNSGNSGGPLVNADNNLIGVVFSKVAIPGYEGLNFVLPNFFIEAILPRLFEGGKVEHSWMGLGVFEVAEGLKVSYIDVHSFVEKSALEVGDIITHINDQKVSKIVDVQSLMLSEVPNTLYKLRVINDKKNTSIRYTEEISYEEYEEQNTANQDETQELASTPETREVLLQSSVLPKAPIGQQTKGTIHTVFPILTGAEIEVTKYSTYRPVYRITHVYQDTPAARIRLSPGDIVAVRKIRHIENILQVQLQILQQSRGYLTSVIVLTAITTPRNFI